MVQVGSEHSTVRPGTVVGATAGRSGAADRRLPPRAEDTAHPPPAPLQETPSTVTREEETGEEAHFEIGSRDWEGERERPDGGGGALRERRGGGALRKGGDWGRSRVDRVGCVCGGCLASVGLLLVGQNPAREVSRLSF